MTGQTPLFEIAAEGELFDTRPLTTPAQAKPPSAGPLSTCPACGRDVLTPGECPRCVTNGHTALTMEEG